MASVAGEVHPLISTTSRSLDRLDTLSGGGDELLLMDLLSRARPVASRVIRQVIDLTIDSFDNVLHKLLGIIKRQRCSLVGLMPTLSLSKLLQPTTC